MIEEKDYIYYEDFLAYRLWFCHLRANRLRFLDLFHRDRPYKVFVSNELPAFGIKAQANAISYYSKKTDYVFIMRDLIDLFAVTLSEASSTQIQYSWMFHIILLFCGFHEFGHLYLGHCQMNQHRRMMLNFSDYTYDNLSSKEIQAMEFSADMYAVDQLADFVREQINSNEYHTLWEYDRIDEFYSDALRAICGFFSIIKRFEYIEQKKRALGKQTEYDHPSFLLREYLVGELFMSWMDSWGFGRKDCEFIDLILHTDSLFMGLPHDQELMEYQYSTILDKSINDHIRHVLDYCNNVLDRKTAPYSRLKASGTFTIKLSDI